MKRTDVLKQHIEACEIEQALAIINGNADPAEYKGYSTTGMNHEFSKAVFREVLQGHPANIELVNAALARFAATRENEGEAHGYWVHSLSHLTSLLWSAGLKEQIKQLNEIAFVGANDFSNNNCCNRLVGDFLHKAPWDANPAEYGLTEDNLRWALTPSQYQGDNTTPEDGQMFLDMVKLFPFASEEEARPIRNKW